MPSRTRHGHFTPELFTFLKQLKRNNRRDWFERNKSRYLEHVRDPMLHFISDLGPKLARLSLHIVADPSPVGGSLFRIYRDVRFSRDKSPYKTWAAARFPIEGKRNVHTPSFYLGMSPGSVHMGAGIWHPERPELEKIRRAIVAEPAKWRKVKNAPSLKKSHVFSGESLVRPPRGFDPDHPFIEDLRRKDFVTFATLDERTVCRPDFLERFTRLCRETSPLVRWLCGVLKLPW